MKSFIKSKNFLGNTYISILGILAAFLCAIICSLYFYWLSGKNDFTVIRYMPSFIITILVCGVLLMSVNKLEELWMARKSKIDFKSPLVQFIIMILWMIFINVILIVWLAGRNQGMPLGEVLDKGWEIGIDRYFPIAEKGYQNIPGDDHTYTICFLPLYPILLKLLKSVFTSYAVAYLVLNNFCAILSGVIMYRLACLELGKDKAAGAVKYLLLMPAAFFLFVPMTEGLFLMLSVCCMYCLYKKKYLGTGIFAFLTAFTKIQGIVIIIPILIEYIGEFIKRNKESKDYDNLKRVLVLLAAPLAFLIYLLINYVIFGNPFQFMIFQREHWGNQANMFWETIQYIIYYLFHWTAAGDVNSYIGISIPAILTLVGTLVIIFAGAKKRRVTLTAYALSYYIASFSTTWLLSAPRYAVCLFPIALTLADISSKNKWVNRGITAAYAIMFVLYMYAFMQRYSVF